MALGWKLVIDAADPHRQAAFWAAALDYEIEDNTPVIERLLGLGAIDASMCVEKDGRRNFRDAVAARHPDDPVAPDTGIGTGRRLLFQRVPEAGAESKKAKNRLHIDVHAGPERREATVAKLVALGATRVRHVQEPQGEWHLLLDPEGNEFCVA